MPLFKRVSREEEFWTWFQKNEDSIFSFEEDQERVFLQLRTAMKKVHSDLTFELSVVKDGKREFVISADGIRTAFPAVETLYDKAPALPRWTIVKFRQRHGATGIQMGDIKVMPEDIEFSLEDGAKVGINSFIKGYNEANARPFLQIAFILLDHAIGEYDMETKVGEIKVFPYEKNSTNPRYNIDTLPSVFDILTNSHKG